MNLNSRTIALLRSSYFPAETSARIVRHAFRFATIAGILLVSSHLELISNVIAFTFAWIGLLALSASDSRALSLGSSTMNWPGIRVERAIAGLTAVELLAIALFIALSIITQASPALIALTAGVLLMQNLILIGHETALANGHDQIERFIRGGGFSLVGPIIVAATVIPLRDAVPTDTVVSSASLVAIFSTELAFVRRLGTFTPGFFIPGYLKQQIHRFALTHSIFAGLGALTASLLVGIHPGTAAAMALSIVAGALFLHGFILYTRGLGKAAIMFLALVLTSALTGIAAAIRDAPSFIIPLMLVASAVVALPPIIATRRLSEERIIRNR